MMNSWCSYSIADFIEINPKVPLTIGSRYSFVEMKDINLKQKFVKPSSVRILKGGTRFENGDTLFARITPCLENGKIAQVKGLKYNVGFGSTEFLVFRGKKGVSDNDFVFYLSNYELLRQFAIQNMVGTSGRQRVSKDVFERLVIQLPPLPTQEAIAEILSSLDDKIELNNAINKNLEDLAQTLFKRWFVDFEFPNENGQPYKSSGGEMVESELGMVPKGWKIRKIREKIEVSDFVANGSFASLKAHVSTYDTPSYAVFVRNTDSKTNFSSQLKYADERTYNFLSKSKLFGSEICISNVADVGTVFRPPVYLKRPMTLGNNLVLLRSNNPNYLYYYFKYFMGKEQINSITSGSAQSKFNKTDFRNLRFLQIKDVIAELFENNLNDFWELQCGLLSENINLSRLRDTLLLKLISGELEVKEAQTQIKNTL